ncbi:MAG TPA: hypothetical protein VFD36_07985, partial [Kofleriaceae bacterium]|nr:hypothetical protein [Kofleriaceae bacterium]
MSRRALARLSAHFLGHDLRRRAARRWLVVVGLGLGLAVAATTLRLGPTPATPRPSVRMAIRVQCLDAPCSLPESLALDIWSEHRGPRLPLDIVVTRDALA